MKPVYYSALFAILLCIICAGPARAVDSLPPAPFQKAVKTGAIQDPMVAEASGIFASRTHSPILWMVNDGNNPPELAAVRPDGRVEARFLLVDNTGREIKNRDWEDLSGYDLDGQTFLVIAEVGDNWARYETCSLFGVREPDLTRSQGKKTIPIEWEMTFQYEDGPRDCEAVAADPANNRILLLSKRQTPPTLYELPLPDPGPENTATLYTARPIARVETIPAPTRADLKEKYGKYRSWPTSMDLSPDGLTLVILTYKHGYIYTRHPGQTWDQAFKAAPKVIRLPLPETGELVQREAICMAPPKKNQSGNQAKLYVTTEQLPAPIYVLEPMD